MTHIQNFLCMLQDVLLQTRTLNKPKPTQQPLDNYGVTLRSPPYMTNRDTIIRDWNSKFNEVQVFFYMVTNGRTVMVEEWNIRLNLHSDKPFEKQARTFMRSFITLTQLIKFDQNELKYEFFFNVQALQKQYDWLDTASIRNQQLQANLGLHRITVNLAYQDELPMLLLKKVPRARQEKLSSQGSFGNLDISRTKTSSDRLRKLLLRTSRQQKTAESDSSNSSRRKSFVSLFSRTDDVEILSTPDGADQILGNASMIDDFEIQMIIYEEDLKQKTQLVIDERTSYKIKMKQEMINHLESMKKNLKKDPSQTHIDNVIKLVISQK